MSDRFDLVIVGGGIVGLATALQLLRRRPALRLVILEKEAEVAMHQSGHNSGVLHAGLYYTPGSLKARLCLEGKAAVQAYASEKGIPFELCGKLVVALDESELGRFAALKERAAANNVPGLREVRPEEIREIEPHAAGILALHSPTTGIIDYRRVALAYADDVSALGAEIRTASRVSNIRARASELVVTVSGSDGVERDVIGRNVITCAGLQSDKVAGMTGAAGNERIVPFRGDYYTLTPDARHLCNGLIYPVPDPAFPFLGVHFTKRIDGEVWAGPNAVLAFAREGYARSDISPRQLASTLMYRGFQRLALKYLKTGLAEMWRDFWKAAFLKEMQRYVPEIRGDQIFFGPSGVRAQSLRGDGSMVDDFSLGESEHVIHVRNAPSPAATASLAIGRELAERAIGRFELA
jgi:(S)-2-hydroxyglutarate dehydrogenase